MWLRLSSIILKYRLFLLLATVLFTAFMGYKGRNLELSYDYIQFVPKEDPDMIFFQSFKKQFGEDGNILAIGIEDKKLFEINTFHQYYTLCQNLSKIKGVHDIISLPTLKKISKDTVNNSFVTEKIFKRYPQNQSELDQKLKQCQNTKFYDGLIFNPETKATLIAVSIKKEVINSNKRQPLVDSVLNYCAAFEVQTGIQLHYAGLPYVRSIIVKKFQKELKMLMYLSGIVTCVILFYFFRTLKALLFTALVVVITIVWATGTIVLLGYKVNMLTGLMPPLIVVISIPNCIYMFNRYHQEYRKHNNKIRAITRVIEKVGFLTFMTNINTAVGFFVLLSTDTIIFKEFGMLAGIMSVATFLISLIVIPSLFAYLPAPKEKHLQHLDKGTIHSVNDFISKLVLTKAKQILIFSTIFTIVAFYAATKIRIEAFMVDDLPNSNNVVGDMKFFESNFKGMMPLEILVDLGKKKGIYQLKNLKKLEEFETYILTVPYVSPPLSILNITKGATQAFYNDDTNSYRLPTNSERPFLMKYFQKSTGNLSLMSSLVDSNAQVVRFTMKVADLGTKKMDSLINKVIIPGVDKVFKDTKFKTHVTGTTLLFLKGNNYLFNDLLQSLLIAFALISVMMAFLFTDIKMILISIIPNIIPIIITVAIMAIFDIRMKTSTSIIFSISFGITIDSTIHILSKFKQEMKIKSNTLDMAIINSIKEGAISTIYTTLVLFCGFSIFMLSEFGGTQALGLLTCVTLLFALFTNLILLPALIKLFVKKNIVL